MKPLAILSFLVFLGGNFATADVKRSVDELECIKEMEHSTPGQDSFKFVPSDSGLTYEIVEIPGERKAGKYVTYYTDSGYTEINAQKLDCNINRKKTDKAKTVSAKMLAVFKAREKQLETLFNETMDLVGSKGWIDANSAAERTKRLELSALQAFRKKCAAAFVDINAVLIASGSLKERPALRNCQIGGAMCPPRAAGEESGAPR